RLHPGRDPARARVGRGRARPPDDRHHRDRRHAGRLADRDLPDPRVVLRGGALLADGGPRVAARRARRAHGRPAFVRDAAPAAALAALVLAGCALGPRYQRPAELAPEAYRGAPPDPASIADLPWFEVFGDAALRGLVEEALANNRDLA